MGSVVYSVSCKLKFQLRNSNVILFDSNDIINGSSDSICIITLLDSYFAHLQVNIEDCEINPEAV